VTSPKREFAEYVEALRARLGREQRPPTRDEWLGLRDRHDTWVRWTLELDDTPPGPGHLRVVTRPTPWELFEVEFGHEPEVEPPEDATPDEGGRPTVELSREVAEELEAEVRKRIEAPDEDTRSLRAIARRTGVKVGHVRRMEELVRAGWSCAKTPQRFSHTGDMVLPTVKKYLEARGF
jgi:hypothetical protein